MANLAKQAAASSATRVIGVSTEQTIRDGAGVLQRVVVANGHASTKQTLTLTDGAAVKHVIHVPAGTTLSLDYGVRFATSIKVTPSDNAIDALVIFD